MAEFLARLVELPAALAVFLGQRAQRVLRWWGRVRGWDDEKEGDRG